MKNKLFIVSLLFVISASYTQARIKLVALPEREATIIRLDNPTVTLIEEERTLTLQQGLNNIDFSWKAVSIDKDSIRLLVISHPDKVKLLSVSYPPGENALVWDINAEVAAEIKVRISYLLYNIDRLVTYKAVAEKDETKLNLKSYLVLRNFSGEDFDYSKILLDYGKAFEQDIKNEETKKMLFLNLPEVPVTKIWNWDAASQAWDPEKLENQNVGIPVSYQIANTKTTDGLGDYALWNGKARVYQKDGHGSTIFLGEDNLNLVPVGEKAKIYIGDSRDIVVTQRKMKEEQTNVRRNDSNRVVLFDTDEEIVAEIENFKDSPATLTMTQYIEGQWQMTGCNMDYTKKDYRTLEFEIQLAPKEKKTLTMKYRRINVRPNYRIQPY